MQYQTIAELQAAAREYGPGFWGDIAEDAPDYERVKALALELEQDALTERDSDETDALYALQSEGFSLEAAQEHLAGQYPDPEENWEEMAIKMLINAAFFEKV